MDRKDSYSVSEGLLVGLAGYAAVVIVVALLDLLLGRPLFTTPSRLGSGLVATAPPAGTISTPAVLAYNAVHLLAFLVAGVGLLWLTRLVEVHPAFWYLAIVIGLFAFNVAVFAITALEGWGAALPWWAVFLATVAAAAAMGVVIRRRHPEPWKRVHEMGELAP